MMKPGSKGGRWPPSLSPSPPARIASENTSTTGASIDTRISLTTVAVSPTSGPIEKPAPTTCATSWMVAPRNTPDSSAVNPKADETSG